MEEKRKVAEWLDGRIEGERVIWYRPDLLNDGPHYIGQFLKDWNPDSDTKATFAEWAEIYERMDEGFQHMYMINLRNLLYKRLESNPEWRYDFKLHTALPSIRWKALIQTITETNNPHKQTNKQINKGINYDT